MWIWKMSQSEFPPPSLAETKISSYRDFLSLSLKGAKSPHFYARRVGKGKAYWDIVQEIYLTMSGFPSQWLGSRVTMITTLEPGSAVPVSATNSREPMSLAPFLLSPAGDALLVAKRECQKHSWRSFPSVRLGIQTTKHTSSSHPHVSTHPYVTTQFHGFWAWMLYPMESDAYY